ncbi:MAG: aldehyde dehydrogenase, partial [Chloroflexota bacterium]
ALYANRRRWVDLSIPERIQILDEIIPSLQNVAQRWVDYSRTAKIITPDKPGYGEDWTFVTLMFRQITTLKQSLKDILEHGRPQIPGEVYTRDDGRVVAEVFPRGLKDQLLFNKLSGEIWFNPGVTQAQIMQRQGLAYRTHTSNDGRVALVLGAGNVSALIPGDFLYKLFVENQVVILKMNPVNEYLGPLIEEGYAPLISRGFLRVVYGGVEEASHLINHDFVRELHITGSDKTFDAIVFGTEEAGTNNKQNRTPVMTKRFTAELGNITPMIIVPGPWTPDDVTYQADALANQLVVNAGFNCLTPRMVVNWAGWNQRDAFNTAFNAKLASTPTRNAYYPHAADLHSKVLDAHTETANLHGKPANGELPWTYITGVDASASEDPAFSTEPFCALMSETAIEAASIAEYIDKAVEFVNEKLWGTLVAGIIVHPESLKDPQVKAAVDRAIANLRYGSICINSSTAIAYTMNTTAWGGHSGSDVYNVQSGISFVNNVLMFDDRQIQKSVIKNTFRSPLSSQDITTQRFSNLAERLAWFEAEPNIQTTFQLAR